MNKTAIKNFAVWARVQLIEAAEQRAYSFEVTESGPNRRGLETASGRVLTAVEREQRDRLIDEIAHKGYNDVVNNVESIVSDCVSLSHSDWDSFETSWDFQRNPLV